MEGMAVGRAVDLTRLRGYEDLHRKLEEMFDIHGELSASLKNILFPWEVLMLHKPHQPSAYSSIYLDGFGIHELLIHAVLSYS